MVFYCPKEAQMDKTARNISIVGRLMAGGTLWLPVTKRTLGCSEDWKIGFVSEDGNLIMGDLPLSQVVALLEENEIGRAIAL